MEYVVKESEMLRFHEEPVCYTGRAVIGFLNRSWGYLTVNEISNKIKGADYGKMPLVIVYEGE